MFPVEGVAVHQVLENSEYPNLNKTNIGPDSEKNKSENYVVELLN